MSGANFPGPIGPRFITLEGIEGCGKSTQAKLLGAELASRGDEVLVTREPGGLPVGEAIRHILLKPGNVLTAETEALLYSASRAEHADKVIAPALAAGRCVICDRYFDSSLAYQGVARGLGLEWILDLNLWATRGIVPDLTLILDLPVEAGMARIAGRAQDRIESESITFHEAVRAGFIELAELFPERVRLIPAAGSRAEVQAVVASAVAERFGS